MPVTQNYHEAPILENSWPCKPFCCGCPYEKKSRNLVLPPSQSTLKYGSEKRPWVRVLRTPDGTPDIEKLKITFYRKIYFSYLRIFFSIFLPIITLKWGSQPLDVYFSLVLNMKVLSKFIWGNTKTIKRYFFYWYLFLYSIGNISNNYLNLHLFKVKQT